MSKMSEGPVVLIVLDGVGEIAQEQGNAVALARTPVWDALRKQHRFTSLRAHGLAVGLPSEKDMGNSEVGHNALGAGQIYQQGAKLVNDALASGELYRSANWKTAIEGVKTHERSLHFIGLLSDGNIHSHIDHLVAMLEQAAREEVQRVRVHVLLDGRDVSATSAHLYLERLNTCLTGLNQKGLDYRIASGGGRMKVTMDRYEADWEMVHKGWQLHVLGRGPSFPDAMTALTHFREKNPGILDQNLPGFVISEGEQPVGPIVDGDSVIFFNFRGDRAMEISRAFDEGPEFTGFDRVRQPQVFYAGMMEYDGDTHCPRNYLVGPPKITNTLTDFLAVEGVTQFAVSETQKFGHITFFWNGNRSGKVDERTETYVNISSDNVPFEQRPWMKAAEITDALIAAIRSGKYRFLRANYANGDMVGHTGDLQAAVTAMTCLDLQLGRLMKAIKDAGGVAIITADHGNCEEMYETDKAGLPLRQVGGGFVAKTSHSLAPVPFVLYDTKGIVPGHLRKDAEIGIANVAATVTTILGFEAPALWSPSLLIDKP